MIINLICLLINILLHNGQVISIPDKESSTTLVTNRPEVIIKLPGQPLELRCVTDKSHGNGRPKVRWLKNGKLIEKRKLQTPRAEIHGRRLSIDYIDYNDYGTYHCISRETNQTLNVFKVTLNDDISDAALRNIHKIRVHPEKKIVEVGKDVTFECYYRIKSFTNYDIKWLKNYSKDEVFNNVSGEQPIVIDGSNYKVLNVPIVIGNPSNEAYYYFSTSLKIKNVQLRNSGNYACLLNDSINQFYAFTALRVVVHEEEDHQQQIMIEDLLIKISSDYQEQIPDHSNTFLAVGLSSSLFIIVFVGLWYILVIKSCIERISQALTPRNQSPQQLTEWDMPT